MRAKLLCALLLTSAACHTIEDPVRHGYSLFCNGHIYLGAPDWKQVPAMLVESGRIVAVGREDEMARLAKDWYVQRVDLQGGYAVPGLQDAHGHMDGYGASLESVDLRGVASFDEVIAHVKSAAAKVTAGTWIQGRGWDQNLWPDKSFPNHAALSAAVPNHPVCLARIDGHAVLVNQRALELAHLEGVAENENVVPGGRMVLDGEHRPTGVFVDNAADLFAPVIPEPDDATRERRLLLAQEQLLALGITAVHDM